MHDGQPKVACRPCPDIGMPFLVGRLADSFGR